ncbi:MAG: PAS domain-containing protein, partial [Deltaproteobacteria bacterium]|nr:PAS domain-containing protein [Deltaproteobacteria bacterium]
MADKPTYEELEQKLKDLEKQVSRIGVLEKTIKETREHAEPIVAIVREPLLVLDAELRVIFANRSFYQVFKITPRETHGQLLFELGNRQWDLPKLRELIEHILLMDTTLDGYEVEHEFEHIGRRVMRLNARRISGEANKKPLIFLTFEDVTERNLAEMKLKQSEGSLAQVERIAHLGNWTWNIVTNELDWSDEIYRIFGWVPQEFEVTYETFLNFVHPEDRKFVIQSVDNALYENKPYRIDHRIILPDGRERIVHEHAEVIFDKTGRPIQMIGTIQDISEFKRTKDELRKSKAMLQSIFDGISDSLILLGEDLIIHAINRPTLDYYTIKNPDQVIGKPCFVGLGNRNEICDGCTIHAAVSEGKEQKFQRRSLKNPEQFEEVSLYPIIDNSGNIEATIIRIHDITEEKQMERQLIQSEKLASIGVLVSGIAHEINNPNNYISVNIPILRDYINTVIPIIDEYAEKHPDLEILHMSYAEFREDIIELLDNIQYGSRQIKSIVKDLKVFSKPDQDKPIEKIDLKPMFEKVVAFCRNKIGKTVKTFAVDIPENLPEMLIDRKPLEQILINLLINSANAFDKPADENSRVDLVVSMDDSKENQLIIEVSDNGRGMDEKILEKIFDPFFTTNPSEEGTGLGMYIVHNLTEKIGGRIQVESKLGEGSKFTVILDI